MFLAVDIGNTNINFGLFKCGRLVRKLTIATKAYSIVFLRRVLGGAGVEDCLICSVVPKATAFMARDLKALRIRSYIIGKDILVPIRNLYRKPSQVGQDRLVNAYAGVRLYGKPLIVVDFGTAVTFDIISKQGYYLGGMILPGLQLSLDALGERTALLPKIKLAKPVEFIGRDTKCSMLSGVVIGLGALTDDMVSRIKARIGRAKVVGTGGSIGLMRKYSKKLDRIDADLTLKGIYYIWQKKCKENS